MITNTTIINQVKDLPTDVHYAILVESVAHQSADWGHGQESYSTSYLEYIVCKDDAALEKWILEEGQKKKYQVIKVFPASVAISAKVFFNFQNE